MSERFVIGDLHLGHMGILNVPGRKEFFSGMSIEEHDEFLVEQWNNKVTNRDVVYLMGDVGYDKPSGYLTKNLLPRLEGRIKLVAGNHDNQAILTCKAFFQVAGVETVSVKGYRLILTHIPIHPQEMFWDLNIHGHLHANQVKARANDPQGGKYNPQRDLRYACVSAEHCPGWAPILIEDVVDKWRERGGEQFNAGEFRRR